MRTLIHFSDGAAIGEDTIGVPGDTDMADMAIAEATDIAEDMAIEAATGTAAGMDSVVTGIVAATDFRAVGMVGAWVASPGAVASVEADFTVAGAVSTVAAAIGNN
jgi:hypothetical protein